MGLGPALWSPRQAIILETPLSTFRSLGATWAPLRPEGKLHGGKTTSPTSMLCFCLVILSKDCKLNRAFTYLVLTVCGCFLSLVSIGKYRTNVFQTHSWKTNSKYQSLQTPRLSDACLYPSDSLRPEDHSWRTAGAI